VRPNDVVASCRGIVQIYRSESGEVHALRGIDADFESGSLTAVVGPSGSGKSSLMRILSLVERPAAGELRIAGVDPDSIPSRSVRRLRRRAFGIVAQRATHNLFPHLTVVDHIELGARHHRADVSDIDRAIESVGLAHRRVARPHQLSGGEQQRVAIAMATVGTPALVFADEPTAELDPEHADQVIALLQQSARTGAAVIVNTHDHHVANGADRVLTLRHGTLHSERDRAGTLAVIDSVGRIQLPPEALKRFPGSRAEILLEDGSVRLVTPAGDTGGDADE
jgi:putative ABC transport system ATP-binding protein